MEITTEKKRRGRKSKSELALINEQNSITDNIIVTTEKLPKKRGRKPKGGKVMNFLPCEDTKSETKINIILHLKCSKSDIYNYNIPDIPAYDSNPNFMDYSTNYQKMSELPHETTIDDIEYNSDSKLILQKLEKLSNSLRIDNVCDKKSACFFCTCEFDNTPIYIPKYQLNNVFHVYGCFCSPECACAYLMNERNIDSNARSERYYLLNFIYSKIYNYEKNIKPAPCPFYTLDKYYGSLSIQEYRKLLKTERLLLVVDKPLIRSMPELHDDSDDYLLNSKGISTTTAKLSIQPANKQITKNSIVCNQFNLKN